MESFRGGAAGNDGRYRMSAVAHKAIPVWTSDDGWVTNLRIEHSAPPPRPTKSRQRLTPDQRGRFWQSIVETSSAAKAEPDEGRQT